MTIKKFTLNIYWAPLLVVVVALGFALYTNHTWEDYYITYRSSKNLATGHGLVFNHGDRLHTFTSPLGVLLPAIAYLFTFNHSDTAALWIFRLMSCTALGSAALLLLKVARIKNYAPLAAILMIFWVGLDSKIIDFSINGMETAFLILFLSYTLWAHLVPTSRPWLHLGGAWAGLMWTRPDSFVYIGLIAAGFWLFNDPTRSGTSRRNLLGLYIRAGLVTTAIYLPWLLFAWGYYGTPIPHTITAKSGFGDPRTLSGLIKTILQLPFTSTLDTASLEATFLPAYYRIGGWPEYFIQASRLLATGCSLLWLLPFLRMEVRATSFAFFGAHAYLSYFPYFPFPWYLPSTTLLAIFALSSLLAQLLSATEHWQTAQPLSHRPLQFRLFATLAVGLVLLAASWETYQVARLFKAQQKYVEEGNRRKIGEWLHEHALPKDTVFMEPLGYIGYYSGLKTYDWPGMSSREMVRARKIVGNDWIQLITYLQPQWLVLRPNEIRNLTAQDASLLTQSYMIVQNFSVADQLKKETVYGRNYLEFDANFTVYQKTIKTTAQLDLANATSPFKISQKYIDHISVTFAHAPSNITVNIPTGASRGSVQFGFEETAYAPSPMQTDGATFKVYLIDGESVVTLASRQLNPASQPADRGLQTFTFILPRHSSQATLLLNAAPGQTMTKDWTCWSLPAFH